MTAPVIVQPDLEAWVWANIRELRSLGELTSFSYAATQLGGHGWIYAHYVQVDVRHNRKEAARALAETVRQTILALPDVPWPEGTICYAQAVEGPFWLPDDDGQPRYTARYEIRVHPRRSAAPAPAEAS
jgi:Bacteriophage minor capsid protein